MPSSDQGVILVLCSSHATQVLTCALLRLAEVTAVTQDPLRAACCFHLHQGVLWGPCVRNYIPLVQTSALTVPARGKADVFSHNGSIPQCPQDGLPHRRPWRRLRWREMQQMQRLQTENQPIQGYALFFIFYSMCFFFLLLINWD